MRKLFFISLLSLPILLVSCNGEEESLTNPNIESKLVKFESLTNSQIGYEENGELKLTVSKGSIFDATKKIGKEANLELNPISFEILTIDSRKFLRVISENKYVTTVEIFKSKENIFSTGGTSCTSTACAYGGGCVPSGQYCTKCTRENGLPGDCVRTTTGGNPPDA